MSAPEQCPAVVPWRFFEAHRGRPFAFFLDRGLSALPSFAGSRPREQLVVEADASVRLWRGGEWTLEAGDPIAHVASFVESRRARPARVPPWLEGATLPRTVGYLSYELGRWADGPRASTIASTSASRGSAPRARIGTPLAVLSAYDEIDAWDPRGLRSERIRLCDASASASADPPPLAAPPAEDWLATGREAYRAAFGRIRDAIAAGDIYQANLSRRCVFELDEDPAGAYGRLREVQPVPWGAFLDFGGFALLSNSPECFLERRGRRIVTRPIKGTRPRRGDPAEDASERDSIAADPKEMAEHLMIVDLERNDLGRVAETGSVEVRRFATVESFATVHHMVSEIGATLREPTGLAALLRATFPGGSITGAPKIRAMEILEEVEGTDRGPYTGAIGWFDGGERLDLAIAIRTAIVAKGRALYSSGGGIVADSDVDREWDETELKREALRRALAGAAPGRPAAALRTGTRA